MDICQVCTAICLFGCVRVSLLLGGQASGLRIGKGSRPRTHMYDIIRPRDLIFAAALFAFAVVCVYMHVYRHVCTRVRTEVWA